MNEAPDTAPDQQEAKAADNRQGQAIVLISGKGGVGRTTLAANLGTALAMEGQRVALVDGVVGLRTLDLALGLENRIVYDLVDLARGNCRLKQALIRDKKVDSLSLLPTAATAEPDSVDPDQMKAIVDDLKAQFDFVIIDGPPGIANGFNVAIAGADKAIVVVTPETASIRNADRAIGMWDAAKVAPAMLIVNRIQPALVADGIQLETEDIIEMLSVDLLGIVPEDAKVSHGWQRSESVVFSKESRSAQAFRNIVARLLGRETPILELEPDNQELGRREVAATTTASPSGLTAEARPMLGLERVEALAAELMKELDQTVRAQGQRLQLTETAMSATQEALLSHDSRRALEILTTYRTSLA